MALLNTTQLAQALSVSKGRVSQYVSEGKLKGCYTGDGLQRRFDLDKVAAALGRTLHPGQMLGNGAQTRQALRGLQIEQPRPPIEDDDEDDAPPRRPASPPQRESGELGARDPDRYELARTQKAEEEARRLRRMNAEAEGTFVLASAVERQVAQLMAQELAEVETVMRDAARRIADKLGVEFKAARQILMDQWREHRAKRTEALTVQAAQARLAPDEAEQDI